MHRLLVLAFLFASCTSSQETENSAVLLSGMDFQWELFNHRLSYLLFDVGEESARISVIGGTSTTGQVAELAESCVAAQCQELPFLDSAVSKLYWTKVDHATDVHFGTSSTERVLTSAGDTFVVEMVLPAWAGEENLAAVITGFSLDTDTPLVEGDSCYDPAFGWNPRSLKIDVLPVSRIDERVGARVNVVFDVGSNGEQMRQCMDEVFALAQVKVKVTLTFISTSNLPVLHPISASGEFELKDEQPAPVAQSVEAPNSFWGWNSLHWTFRAGEGGRGTYLRRLAFVGDPDKNTATGFASNYSKGTQLHGFEYGFQGRLLTIPTNGELTHGVIEQTLPASLSAAGRPLIHTLNYTEN